MNKLRVQWKENKGITVFVSVMAVYYGWHLFALDPWYDELYTYYSFICRGPVYAAIHWPVPNNHVFYSVLSACLNVFQNPFISLRGISWLAALGNLILLYRLGRRFFDKPLAFGGVVFYASLFLVNSLSIQGRGYTLAAFFYLSALLMLYEICVEERNELRYLVVFSLSLTAGLYTLTSSVYWVLPVCFVGGCFLLLRKQWKRLWKLVAASLIAAANTFGLYSILWLAIGSNLLSKTPDSGFYGIYQVDIILSAPFRAWKQGVDYMLATPYIQSMNRGEVVAQFGSWVSGLLGLFLSGLGAFLGILLLLSLCTSLLSAVRAYRKKELKKLFLHIYIAGTLVVLPIILVVQSVQPYYRVFSFLGVLLALVITADFQECFANQEKRQKGMAAFLLFFAIVQLGSPAYNAPYAGREVEIKEIWQQAEILQAPESMHFVDDYQKYVLQFYWGFRPEETSLQESPYLLLPREVTKAEYKEKEWPVLYTYEEMDQNYLESCDIIGETKEYILYRKKK